MLAEITYQNNNLKSSSTQKDSANPPYLTTEVPSNRRSTPLEIGQSTKMFGMWTLKHETRSPRFDELLIKKYLKGDTTLDLKNF